MYESHYFDSKYALKGLGLEIMQKPHLVTLIFILTLATLTMSEVGQATLILCLHA